MITYEYVDRKGGRAMMDWPLEKRQRQGLRRKMRILRSLDREMVVGSVIFATKVTGIYRTKIRGNVQLRPRLCLGPPDPETEITFLERCEERGGKEHPPDVSERARRKLDEVADDPDHRRRVLDEEDLK